MNYLRAMLGVSNILNDSFMPMKKVFLGLLLVSLIIGLIVYMLSWNLKRSTLKTYNQNVVTAPYDVIIVPGIPYDTGHQNILLKVRLFWAKNLFDKNKEELQKMIDSILYKYSIEQEKFASQLI